MGREPHETPTRNVVGGRTWKAPCHPLQRRHLPLSQAPWSPVPPSRASAPRAAWPRTGASSAVRALAQQRHISPDAWSFPICPAQELRATAPGFCSPGGSRALLGEKAFLSAWLPLLSLLPSGGESQRFSVFPAGCAALLPALRVPGNKVVVWHKGWGCGGPARTLPCRALPWRCFHGHKLPKPSLNCPGLRPCSQWSGTEMLWSVTAAIMVTHLIVLDRESCRAWASLQKSPALL